MSYERNSFGCTGFLWRYRRPGEHGAPARSIKPLEGSRPWLRRTRALCKFNCGKVRIYARPGAHANLIF
jgi:hypothetical protein